MKKILLGAIATAVLAVPALAADLPARTYTKAPIAMAPVATWTGCYVGGNIGGGWQKTSATDVGPDIPTATADAGTDTGTGVVGGGQIGCDYQFASNWVVGVQGMFDGAGVKGSHLASSAYAGDNTETFSTKTNWFATLTGRLGYAITPQALLYAKGGVAFVNENYTDTDPAAVPPFAGQGSTNRTGWTVGGGGEYKFSPNWSVFAEYNYIGLGTKTSNYSYNCGSGCPGFVNPYPYAEKQNLQTVLVGVNYRWGGPIVAKY